MHIFFYTLQRCTHPENQRTFHPNHLFFYINFYQHQRAGIWHTLCYIVLQPPMIRSRGLQTTSNKRRFS